MTKNQIWTTGLALAVTCCLVGCPSTGPKIGVSATSHHFAHDESMWSFDVSNTGAADSTLIFTVAASPDWITVSPNTGTISGNVDKITVNVVVNAEPALKQSFTEGVITVQDSNETVEIAISAAPDYLTENFTSNNVDLDFKTITFIPAPDETASYYVAGTEATAEFPVDPSDGLDLGPFFLEDDPVAMTPFLGKQVWLYGEAYSTFYVGSDGYVSFADAVSALVSLEQHFAIPRISALFKDLDPSVAGTISAIQTADAVAITFEDVPEAGTLNSNSFQIVMYFDGMIQISYKNLDAVEGIAGLSFGAGLPSDFVNSDLSAFNTDSISVLLP